MTKLKLVKNVKDIQSILLETDRSFVKKTKNFFLLDEEDKVLASVEDTSYTKKIRTDKDKRYVILVSSLFSNEFRIYSYLDLSVLFMLKNINGRDYFFKDTTFTPDGKYLYVLADEVSYINPSETILLKIELSSFVYTVFFFGEHRYFDSLYFSKTRQVLTLLDKKGKIYFFSQDKIIKKIKVPTFDRLFFIDWGQVMLLSSLAGFNLCSANGKVIRQCDILLPKPLKTDEDSRKDFDTQNEILSLKGLSKMSRKDNLSEYYKDMIFSTEAGALLYLSYNINEKSYTLYHYSIRSFILKHVYRFKKEVYGMELNYPFLYIRTSGGVLIYRILQN